MIAVSATVLGQEGASLFLTVVDERGRPIESAAVILRPELQVPVELPPPFFTDADGRILIEGLREGEWQVEVRSQGFMIFSAYVRLQEGLPPAVGFKSKQRTGTFWAPIEVYFEDVDVDFAMGAKGRKALEKEQRRSLKRSGKAAKREGKLEERRAAEAEKAERMAEKRRAQLGRGAEVASLEERPNEVAVIAAAESTPEEAAAPVVSAEPRAATPLEAIAVAAAEPEPDITQPDEIRAPPAESPAPPVVRSPPPPPPLPPAVPDIQAQPFLFRGGACPECKRGEWALVVERRAAVSASSTVVCGEGREEKVEQIIQQVLRPRAGALGSFAGPLIDAHGNGVVAHLGVPIALPAYEEVAADGPCQDFVAILPSAARFVGFRLEAADAAGKGDCFGAEVCSIGEARWIELPQIEHTATLTVIHASFLNESKSRERRGRFIVLFVPPDGWQAP